MVARYEAYHKLMYINANFELEEYAKPVLVIPVRVRLGAPCLSYQNVQPISETSAICYSAYKNIFRLSEYDVCSQDMPMHQIL